MTEQPKTVRYRMLVHRTIHAKDWIEVEGPEGITAHDMMFITGDRYDQPTVDRADVAMNALEVPEGAKVWERWIDDVEQVEESTKGTIQ